MASYVSGISDEPLTYETVGNALSRAAEQWGDREALVVREEGLRLTYRELNDRAEQLAAGLLALGLEPGDRIGIWAPNCSEWTLTQYATAKAGLILVNINPAYRVLELEYVLNKVGCKALVTAAAFKSSDYVGMLRELMPEIADHEAGALTAARVPSLRLLVCLEPVDLRAVLPFDSIPSYARAIHQTQLKEISRSLQPDEPVNIQFTSGTTGSPKGATLTHFGILNNAFMVGRALALGPDDRMCIPVPLYHCIGMVMGNLGCLMRGATAVFPSRAFEPLAVLETVSAERCTVLYGVPTMFIAILDHPDFAQFDLSSLRTGIMSGAPCPIAIMERVVSEMHMREVTVAYGMTETSPVSFQSNIHDLLERRVSTVGRIHPHLQAKIIDELGQVRPRGEPGELCTRGYSVMRGYWDDTEKTNEAIDAAGWMHTGDIAVLDSDGYCNIVGRIKDLIIRGGENIYPREIEDFLSAHPKIQAVSCFGVPDEKFGEEVCIWVQKRHGINIAEDDIRSFCKDKIAYYKVPRYIKFVDEFPMTVTGKLQKFLMRERMTEEIAINI